MRSVRYSTRSKLIALYRANSLIRILENYGFEKERFWLAGFILEWVEPLQRTDYASEFESSKQRYGVLKERFKN